MVRLAFNKEFNGIEEEITDIYMDIESMPSNIKNFINDTYSSRVINTSNDNKYYCSKCLKELYSNSICPECNKKYTNFNKKYLIRVDNIKDIYEYSDYSYYYVFDVYNDNVVLYKIREIISYKNNLTNYPLKMQKLSMENIYLVNEGGLKDLLNNKVITFKSIDNDLSERLLQFEYFDDDYIDKEPEYHTSCFLYLDNLEDLKNTIYKYTNIWKSKDYLKDNYFSYEHLTFFPLYTKYFEYLIKKELYSIAYNRPDQIKFNSFIKKHLGFIEKYKLNLDEINSLIMIKEENIEEIKKMDTFSYVFIFIEDEYGIPALKIKEYFNKNNIGYNYAYEYLDYLYLARENGLDMKDKKVIFPKNFIKEHDRLYKENIILENPEIESRINDISKILSINNYEDDKYVIFPANSVESLIDESEQQNNCVRTYCQRYSNNQTQIYFMREKEHKDKSLVTIEVNNNKVVQARIKYNNLPDDSLMKVIRKWESTLMRVVKE